MLWRHEFLAKKDTRAKASRSLVQRYQEVTEVRTTWSRIRFSTRRPERPLWRSKLEWRLQNVGDPGTVGVSWGEHGIQTPQAFCVTWGKKNCRGRAARAIWSLDQSIMNSMCLTWSCRICLLCWSLVFGQVFLCYATIPPLVMGIFCLCYYMFELTLFFYIIGAHG